MCYALTNVILVILERPPRPWDSIRDSFKVPRMESSYRRIEMYGWKDAYYAVLTVLFVHR